MPAGIFSGDHVSLLGVARRWSGGTEPLGDGGFKNFQNIKKYNFKQFLKCVCKIFSTKIMQILLNLLLFEVFREILAKRF